jgi:hypothetical protein
MVFEGARRVGLMAELVVCRANVTANVFYQSSRHPVRVVVDLLEIFYHYIYHCPTRSKPYLSLSSDSTFLSLYVCGLAPLVTRNLTVFLWGLAEVA